MTTVTHGNGILPVHCLKDLKVFGLELNMAFGVPIFSVACRTARTDIVTVAYAVSQITGNNLKLRTTSRAKMILVSRMGYWPILASISSIGISQYFL